MNERYAKPDLALTGTWKFVKVNDEYRWTPVDYWGSLSHKDLVDEGEIAQAAGLIFLYEHDWKMECAYSTSLNVSCKGNEKEEISAFLGLPEKEYDY